ncbi:FMN-linked oxidoreductase [Cryphonectria parasitica EP155]|uniref:FMN-linked oxidoreductase n=1 Tax=Cryphonectria parasitica (strain ATCC 38755 / EP155) TaxID=660469 RepID=A0A9P4XWW8_CRYP1|nr:FMN-linked oxidoreductase [Cryphonectria parasitica EP155]KAF3762297.1 FMN-linked oxidoreductase [Cryphonectria parasitica EP155]
MSEATPKKVPIPPRGVDYRGKLVLAPMVRSGELPSRLLALHYGADLVWGPETVDYSMIGAVRRPNPTLKTIDFVRVPSYGQKQPPPHARESIIYRLHPEREGSKHIFQIGTSDPDRAVAAARLVAPDVAGIDVNAGCPKPFSTHDGMGAALLRTPDKLAGILRALVKAIVPEFQIGVSVKIRILETPAETEALVRKLVATGITALTVHCRTTPMRPRERAIRGQLRMVREICHEAGVACLMNGDVEDRESAAKLIDEYGVDGAMIATAAEKNSSCFRAKDEGGMAPWDEVTAKYVEFALDVENRFGNTKYLLNQIIPGKQPAYRLVQSCKTYTALCEALGLTHLVERAKAVDVAVELTKDPKAIPKIAAHGSEKRRTDDSKDEDSSAKRQRTTDASTTEKAMSESSQPATAVALSA